jgi:hypothetical protein
MSTNVQLGKRRIRGVLAMAAAWALAWGLLGGLLAIRMQFLTGGTWSFGAGITWEVIARCVGVGLVAVLGFLAAVLVLGPRVERRGGRVVAGLVPAAIAFAGGAQLEPGYAAAFLFAVFALGCAIIPLASTGWSVHAEHHRSTNHVAAP